MEDQRILHYFIGTICDFSTPPQPVSAPVNNLSTPVEEEEIVDPLYEDPNQTNILDQIAEAEAEEKTFSQMVQEDPEMLEIVHQVEEILESLDEAEEDVLSLEPTKEDHIQFEAEGIVNYTDTAGNTFEAPIVIDDFAEEDNFDLDFTETEEEPDNTPDFF
jgi:hypothetical protein